MKKFGIKEVVATAIGTALFIVLTEVQIPLGIIPNTSLQPRAAVLAFLAAVFGPVVLSALFWRRTNWQGALAGMVSGGVMVFIWKYLVRPNVSFLNFYELLPAFLVSCAMIVIVSLATKAPSKEIIDEFETVQKRMAE